jgi:hypothetical protein
VRREFVGAKEFIEVSFFRRGFIVQIESTKGISHYVGFPFDVDQFGAEFFDQEAPTHNAFCVEILVGKVFVVSEYLEPLAEENVAKFF